MRLTVVGVFAAVRRRFLPPPWRLVVLSVITDGFDGVGALDIFVRRLIGQAGRALASSLATNLRVALGGGELLGLRRLGERGGEGIDLAHKSIYRPIAVIYDCRRGRPIAAK